MYRKKKPIPMHVWVLPLFMAVFGEVLVYLWSMETFVVGRFVAILAFSLGFGSILGFISSLIPESCDKLFTGVIAFLEVVLFAAEYLIFDTFGVFMGADTIGAGAGGVVTNYMQIVVDEIIFNWWRILLLLLPLVLFALFVEPKKNGWKSRTGLAVSAVLMYVLGVAAVNYVDLDKDKMTDSFTFDSACHSFGVHMGFAVDALHATGVLSSELEFDIPVTTTAPATEAEETESVEETVAEETVTEGTVAEETTAPTEPPVVYGPHAYDIDYAALAQTESNSNVASLHSYVASQTAAMENAYTGLFEGKNLIFITAEAFTGAFISEELTPTLYRLMTQGIYFTDYYQPLWGAGTTGGEYSNLVGLVPNGGSCMQETLEQDLFLTMGNQLQKLGYSSAAFHNNDYTYYDRDRTHTLLGYDYFMGYGNGIEEGVQKLWPQSDLEMIDFTVPMYIDKQPFSVYYMSVSGHSTYYPGNAMVDKNYHLVADLDVSDRIRCYIATQMELEAALTSLLAQLEAAGIMDDTVIVVASDHYPYGLIADGKPYVEELMGVKKLDDFSRDRNALIIWSGCIEDMDIVVEDPVMSLDILPTLSNLFGVEYDSRLMAGRDVFSETEPLVIWGYSGSWKNHKGGFLASTGKFTPNEGVEVSEDYVSTMNTVVRNKLKYCKGVANYDYFNYVKAALEEIAAQETTAPTQAPTEAVAETTEAAVG